MCVLRMLYCTYALLNLAQPHQVKALVEVVSDERADSQTLAVACHDLGESAGLAPEFRASRRVKVPLVAISGQISMSVGPGPAPRFHRILMILALKILPATDSHFSWVPVRTVHPSPRLTLPSTDGTGSRGCTRAARRC